MKILETNLAGYYLFVGEAEWPADVVGTWLDLYNITNNTKIYSSFRLVSVSGAPKTFQIYCYARFYGPNQKIQAWPAPGGTVTRFEQLRLL